MPFVVPSVSRECPRCCGRARQARIPLAHTRAADACRGSRRWYARGLGGLEELLGKNSVQLCWAQSSPEGRPSAGPATLPERITDGISRHSKRAAEERFYCAFPGVRIGDVRDLVGKGETPVWARKDSSSAGSGPLWAFMGLRKWGPAGGRGGRHRLGAELLEQQQLLGEGLCPKERARRGFRRNVRGPRPCDRVQGEGGSGRGQGGSVPHQALPSWESMVTDPRSTSGDPSGRLKATLPVCIVHDQGGYGFARQKSLNNTM